jgi:hypothetical protein
MGKRYQNGLRRPVAASGTGEGRAACSKVARMSWRYLLPILLEVAALIHFVKYRSGNWIWLWIIIFLGPLGAAVYIIVEVVPELRATQSSTGWMAKRKRFRYLKAVVQENPSAGNYEELADLYREQNAFEQARECYNHAINSRTNHPDPFYGRALCALELGDRDSAIADLEKAISFDRKFAYQRAMGLLAQCYAEAGRPTEAEERFREALSTSTLSETQFNYALFLAHQGRPAEARELLQRILNKHGTLSGPLLRAQKPWLKRASDLLKQLPAGAPESASASGR